MKKSSGDSGTRCSLCKKSTATIHYTEVINNKMQKIHLCEECARQKGIDIELPFSFSDVLAALSGGLQSMAGDGDERAVKCASCGLTLQELAKSGRLGCARCYDTFADTIKDILKSVQKSPQHTGKMPARHTKHGDKAKRVADLEKALRRAITEERYEDCVNLRDEIRRQKEITEARGNV